MNNQNNRPNTHDKLSNLFGKLHDDFRKAIIEFRVIAEHQESINNKIQDLLVTGRISHNEARILTGLPPIGEEWAEQIHNTLGE